MTRNMINRERDRTVQIIISIFNNLPEFPLMKRVLDLGVDPGLKNIGFLFEKHDTCGIIIDQPSDIPVNISCVDKYSQPGRMNTKPEIHALAHAQSTLSGYSISMKKGEIAEMMLNSGFRSVHSRTIELDFGPADVDIGRK